METVSISQCKDYNFEAIIKQLRAIFAKYKVADYIKPGMSILLKVNLLTDKPPEAAVTTNPIFVKALALLVRELGAEVVIGDSPGGPFRSGLLKKVYQQTGLYELADEKGIKLNYDLAQENISFTGGKYKKSFIIAKYYTKADFVINLPKLKTHGMTMMTGAVKNLFGAIPGLLKAEYHLKMPRIDLFAGMLVDLALCLKPDLTIMDAIVGMEGEGPSAGDPRKFGYIMAGLSPFAVDIAAAYLLGINPLTKLPTIQAAQERGLPASIADIELSGDEFRVLRDVKIPVVEKSSNLIDRKLPKNISNWLSPFLRPRPVFHHEKCTNCADCYRSCPADVITMKENGPEVDLENCIRCFCCQELCKYHAVEIKRPLLGNLLFRL